MQANRTLAVLDLRQNYIGDAGATRLAQALATAGPALRVLDVQATRPASLRRVARARRNWLGKRRQGRAFQSSCRFTTRRKNGFARRSIR